MGCARLMSRGVRKAYIRMLCYPSPLYAYATVQYFNMFLKPECVGAEVVCNDRVE